MKKKSTEELSKLLPTKIPGHDGKLTMMKRNNKTFYCLYPEAVDSKVNVAKGKSLNQACNNVYQQLIISGIVKVDLKKKKHKHKKINRKPLNKKQKLDRKLKRQKTNLKKK